MLYNPMIAFISRLVLITACLLAGTSVGAETPTTYALPDSPINDTTEATLNANTGLQWQLLPGEDIAQIAHLMFPEDSITREKFIRAIIHMNPEHFPAGTYQPLATGAIVQIPDLRAIPAFSVPSDRKRKSKAANNATRNKPQDSSETISSNASSNPLLVQLTTQLEQIAENETRELNTLINQTESLALQVAHIQSIHTSRIHESRQQQTTTPPVAPETIPQLVEKVDKPQTPVEFNDATQQEAQFPLDTVLLLGALLTVLILILVLRSYRKIQERLTRSNDNALFPELTHRNQYEALFLDRNPQNNATPAENSSRENASSDIASEARLMIKQGNSDDAVLFLQKQLATNQFDISGWLLLFELLYSLKNKSNFKKNARRFKRLGRFPDIWVQIQDLGHRLEPNEPLYFDEEKRKEKFFPDSSNSELSSLSAK